MPSTATSRLNGLTTSVAVKAPCRVAATSNVTLSGEQTIGGLSCVTGDRVLLTGQTTASQNGVWVVDTGAWSRATDFNGANDAVAGTLVVVTNGGYTGKLWQLTTNGTITPGTTSLAFEMVGILGASSVEVTTATVAAGATTITVASGYIAGASSVVVFANGALLTPGTDYAETNSTTITLTSPFGVDVEAVVISGRIVTSGVESADVSFVPPWTGGVSRSIQARSEEVIYSEDFDSIADALVAAAALDNGAVIQLPRGDITLDAGLAWTASNVILRGHGEGITNLICTFATGDIICIGDGSANPGFSGVEGISIISTVARTNGSAIRFRNGHGLFAKNVRLDENMFWGIRFDGGADQFSYILDGFEINSGVVGILVGEDLTLVQELWIRRGIIASQTSSAFLLKHVSGMYITEVDGILNEVGVVSFPPAGKQVGPAWFSSVLMDTCNSAGWKIITDGGKTVEWTMVGCWGSSCGVDDNSAGIRIEPGAGTVSDITMSAVRCINNKGPGIEIYGGTDITIDSPHVLSNSMEGAGLHDGIYVDAGVSRWAITGGQCGQSALLGLNHQRYGIYVAVGASDNYKILGVNVLDNVTGGIGDNGTGTSKHIAYNVGHRTSNNGVSAVVVGQSTIAVTHGLANTPVLADVSVTPNSSMAASGINSFWVSAVGATTFTVSVNTNVTTVNFSFAWSARVRGA